MDNGSLNDNLRLNNNNDILKSPGKCRHTTFDIKKNNIFSDKGSKNNKRLFVAVNVHEYSVSER